MKKDLNIINGGLTPKRPPNIVAEMATAAKERQATLPESLKIEKEPEIKKPEYNLYVLHYDDTEPSRIAFGTEEELLRVYGMLYEAMDCEYIVQIIINGGMHAIRGKEIKQLMYKLPASEADKAEENL